MDLVQISNYDLFFITILVVVIAHLISSGMNFDTISRTINNMTNTLKFNLYTEITIDASLEIIWSILIDVKKYPEWNPFIYAIRPTQSDKIILGKDILLECFQSTPSTTNNNNDLEGEEEEDENDSKEKHTKKTKKFQAKITKYIRNQEIGWSGCYFSPLFLEGEHVLELKPEKDVTASESTPEKLNPGRTILIHKESLRGFLIPLLRSKFDTDTRSNFEAMNHALKVRAESFVNKR